VAITMTTLLDTDRTSPLSVVADDHDQIDAALDRVTAAAGGPDRELLQAYDVVVGLLSRHLMGMEVAVCPTIGRRLPGGHRLVRAHLNRARRLERTLRQLGQNLWGDALAPHIPLDVLRERIVAQMAEHRDDETRMLALLDEVLTDAERARMAARLEYVTFHAPTRPHPLAVRRLRWSRALYRPVATVDHVLDTLNSRGLPPPPYARRDRRRVGVWGAYLLGSTVDDANEKREP
jgi:hypothetical protein